MQRDANRLTGLLAVLVVGQAIIIGQLMSRGADGEMLLPRTAAVAVDSATDREAAESSVESAGARRRADRLAALERGLREARTTVRELRRELETAETAHADLQRSRAIESRRFEAELAAARSERTRQATLAAELANQRDQFLDGRVVDSAGNPIAQNRAAISFGKILTSRLAARDAGTLHAGTYQMDDAGVQLDVSRAHQVVLQALDLQQLEGEQAGSRLVISYQLAADAAAAAAEEAARNHNHVP